MEEKYSQHEKRLRELEIEKGEITDTKFLEAEPFPATDGGELLYPLPERCEVTYRLYPTEQSEITCVIVLPLTGWNKKFLGTGNGGQAGVIVRQSLNAGVSRGFATANTDMGSSTDSKKMYRCPERWTDFAHRARHSTGKRRKERTLRAAARADSRRSKRRSAIPRTTTASSHTAPPATAIIYSSPSPGSSR